MLSSDGWRRGALLAGLGLTDSGSKRIWHVETRLRRRRLRAHLAGGLIFRRRILVRADPARAAACTSRCSAASELLGGTTRVQNHLAAISGASRAGAGRHPNLTSTGQAGLGVALLPGRAIPVATEDPRTFSVLRPEGLAPAEGHCCTLDGR